MRPFQWTIGLAALFGTLLPTSAMADEHIVLMSLDELEQVDSIEIEELGYSDEAIPNLIEADVIEDAYGEEAIPNLIEAQVIDEDYSEEAIPNLVEADVFEDGYSEEAIPNLVEADVFEDDYSVFEDDYSVFEDDYSVFEDDYSDEAIPNLVEAKRVGNAWHQEGDAVTYQLLYTDEGDAFAVLGSVSIESDSLLPGTPIVIGASDLEVSDGVLIWMPGF